MIEVREWVIERVRKIIGGKVTDMVQPVKLDKPQDTAPATDGDPTGVEGSDGNGEPGGVGDAPFVAATIERCGESIRLATKAVQAAAELVQDCGGDELVAAELHTALAATPGVATSTLLAAPPVPRMRSTCVRSRLPLGSKASALRRSGRPLTCT